MFIIILIYIYINIFQDLNINIFLKVEAVDVTGLMIEMLVAELAKFSNMKVIHIDCA